MARKAKTETTAGENTTTLPRTTKADIVIALLGRPEGATLDELTGPTGWLPHSTRAVLTGLRKKGHAIVRTKRDDATCYHIVDAA